MSGWDLSAVIRRPWTGHHYGPGHHSIKWSSQDIRHRVVWTLLNWVWDNFQKNRNLLLDMRNWLAEFCFVCIDWTLFGVWWCCDCESYFTAWPEMRVDRVTRISMLACVIKSILLTTFKCVRNYSPLSPHGTCRRWWRVTAGLWSYEGSLCRILQSQGQQGATHRALMRVDEASNLMAIVHCSLLHHVVCSALPRVSKVCHEAGPLCPCQSPPGVASPGSFYPPKTLSPKLLSSLLPPLPVSLLSSSCFKPFCATCPALLLVLSNSIHLEWRLLFWSFITSRPKYFTLSQKVVKP